MNFSDATRIMNEIKNAGALFLNLTGGEVFAHPQFERIYNYAVKKGFVITVLSNASLLDQRIRDILKNNPPRKIEITIYGITPAIFRNVTNSNRLPEEILSNILQLKKDGHNILLKMMVLKENRSDFQLVKDFAAKNDIPFQYDISVLPTLSGDQNVMAHQLSVDEAISLELEDGTDRINNWKRRIENYSFDRNKKFSCGCGHFSYTISADLFLKRCNFITDEQNNTSLNKHSFTEIWSKWNENNIPLFKYEECRACEYQPLCDVCPSISFMLGSESDGRVKRQCELAKARYRLVKEHESSCD